MPDMPTTRVSARGAARWNAGHPWIYRSDVISPPDAPSGPAVVLGPRDRPLGVALWSATSEISLRLVDRDPHATLDQDWWDRRIANALARRSPLGETVDTHARESAWRNTNAYRLVHAEGDGIPSLVVDRYGEWLVVQLSSAGLERYRQQITDALVRLANPSGVLARNDTPARKREGLDPGTELLYGEVPEEITVLEGGVRYVAAPWTGQKTGAFLDQRENRTLMGDLARGRALDCFGYHGSFALHLARRASRVTTLDISAAALERAKRNAELNSVTTIEFVEANAFDWLRDAERSGERFDTIVVDPPAFARSRQALRGAMRGYKEVNLRAMRLLAPGGLLFSASCSYHLTRPLFLEMLESAAADSGRALSLREVRGQPLDHPEILTIPETGYLKGAVLEAMD
jgi:23S rRNA (cytosine1962-C5)-methyltransferase